jgi:hypothetical protein
MEQFPGVEIFGCYEQLLLTGCAPVQFQCRYFQRKVVPILCFRHPVLVMVHQMLRLHVLLMEHIADFFLSASVNGLLRSIFLATAVTLCNGMSCSLIPDLMFTGSLELLTFFYTTKNSSIAIFGDFGCFQALSQNCEKLLFASLCPFVRLPVRM